MVQRADAISAIVKLTSSLFVAFVLILLLKYVLYDQGDFFKNVLLICSILCTRYFLYTNNKSPRTQEKACLVLFVMYDRDLLDPFNVFLLFGVACIREQLRQLGPPGQELVTFACGLIFMLTGWFSVGKILILYNFSFITAMVILVIV